MRRAPRALATLWLVAACRPATEIRVDHALGLRVESAGDSVRLTLRPAAGIRINARAAPAIELPAGAVVRLTGARASADPDYFVSAATGMIDRGARGRHAIVRAVTCSEGERFCRPHDVSITLP